MKSDNDKNELKNLLVKLNKSSQKILETRSYTDQLEKLKIIEELIKEQLRDENSHSTAC